MWVTWQGRSDEDQSAFLLSSRHCQNHRTIWWNDPKLEHGPPNGSSRRLDGYWVISKPENNPQVKCAPTVIRIELLTQIFCGFTVSKSTSQQMVPEISKLERVIYTPSHSHETSERCSVIIIPCFWWGNLGPWDSKGLFQQCWNFTWQWELENRCENATKGQCMVLKKMAPWD